MTSSFPGTRTITSIDVHCEGEVGRILVGSHLLVRGATWSERMRRCETELDWLHRLVLREPRGNPAMCGVLVLPPLDPAAGGHEAVVPTIQGRAWITGHVQHVLRPDDPFPTGLTVGDIWSPVPD